MSKKNKLARFAAIEDMDHVLQFPKTIKGKWNSEFFEKDQPITLELACGGGEYTVALAERFPERNFIGVDIKGNRLFKGAKIVEEKSIKNAGFLRIHIEHLLEYFEEDEVSEIWITFPDPRPRPAKAKQRLTSSRYLDIYKVVLKKDGLINFKTDDPPLFEFSVETAKEYEGCKILQEIYDVYAPEITDELLHIKTHYERMHLKNGLKSHFLQLRLEQF